VTRKSKLFQIRVAQQSSPRTPFTGAVELANQVRVTTWGCIGRTVGMTTGNSNTRRHRSLTQRPMSVTVLAPSGHTQARRRNQGDGLRGD
jgi:hypothetical protein